MRLFFGIELSRDARQALANIQFSQDSVRWIPVQNLHLTLFFLGHLDESKRAELKSATVETSVPAFDIQIEGVGGFPSLRRATAIWAGVAYNPPLIELQHEIARRTGSLQQEPSEKEFTPHITIGRTKRRTKVDISEWAAENASFRASPFLVEQYHLYSSELRPSGAVYTRVESYSLASGK